MSLAPGIIRDSIIEFLNALGKEASLAEIVAGVTARVGEVPESSVRSYLNLNTPKMFERVGRGRYGLKPSEGTNHYVDGFASGQQALLAPEAMLVGRARLHHADCFDWLADQPPSSIQAVVTDPPYGLVEYTMEEKQKLRAGKGGIWRIPPSYDGHKRGPLPRFTVLTDEDRRDLYLFFKRFGILISRVAVPGANIVVASNPLLAHIVTGAMAETGLQPRGYIVRQVMTMRGGDRPKNAHQEFDGVSVMPRSQWEPWVVLRTPLDGRVQDNLRKWRTGGFRRPSKEQPFGDVIRSHPTPPHERKIAPHPSLKPPSFMRELVRAVLPLGEGCVVDPFMGAGSTMAAANAVGYDSVGIELDDYFYGLALGAVQRLSEIPVRENGRVSVCLV